MYCMNPMSRGVYGGEARLGKARVKGIGIGARAKNLLGRIQCAAVATRNSVLTRVAHQRSDTMTGLQSVR